ncbi:MAG: fused MFS/spermidine synthase [Planctomycetes bacterium]|nr:fused MFS/spermidine synthase [Planctomycetota bacterium]
MRIVEETDGLFGHLEVLEHHGTLVLAAGGVFQTVIPPCPDGMPKGMLIRGRDYVELIPYIRPGARSALLIGVGAGLDTRALALYGIDVHGVEIDPAVVRLARKHFGLACEVTVADGRAFLEREGRRFDAIVLDAFAGASPPAHLFTREAFQAIDRRLGPKGILSIHLIGDPRHAAIRAVARTVASVFPHAMAVRSGHGDELQGIYLFAGREPVEIGPWAMLRLDAFGFTGREVIEIDATDAPILNDERTDLEAMSRDIAAAHRRACLALRREPPW